MGTKTPGDYRRKADECRARAHLAELSQQQAAWARLADDWENLANRMDEVAKHWLS